MTHAIVRGAAFCLEDNKALCRATFDCSCEVYYEPEFDLLTLRWSHETEGSDYDDDTGERPRCIQVNHYKTGCNVTNWINAELPDTWRSNEEYPGWWNYDLDLPNGVISHEWLEEWIEWDYAEATPALGRFIARYHVAVWAEAVGLD